MVLYFSIIFTLYFFFVLLLIYGWEKIQSTPSGANSLYSDHFVSIIVAVRNEAKNILKLLASLESQAYPVEKYEVVLVDDQSEDDTVELIQQFRLKSKLNIKLLNSDVNLAQNDSPKKYALSQGIQAARGEIIITTDGDCRMGTLWLQSMISSFANDETLFVSGPVVIQQNEQLLSKIQAMEFSSLIGSGASLIYLNYPLMCNGANLAFRKKTFDEVNGYRGIDDTATGDDVFLMQKIHHRYKNSIVFNKSPEAIVITNPVNLFTQLVSQRKRWASKWNRYQLKLSWFLPVFLFLHYLSFFTLIFIPFYHRSFLEVAFVLIILKFIIDYFFLKKVMDFCKLRMCIGVFLISEILYPVYAILIGIIVHFGRWNWKGRTHKK